MYDYFKLNAHVYPLDALSSETTSQAVWGYIRYDFCKNLTQKFSMKAVCRERYQALITLHDGASANIGMEKPYASFFMVIISYILTFDKISLARQRVQVAVVSVELKKSHHGIFISC